MPAGASARSGIEWQGKADGESAVVHAIWIKHGAFVSRLFVRVSGWVGQGATASPRLSISRCCIVSTVHWQATTPPERPRTREDGYDLIVKTSRTDHSSKQGTLVMLTLRRISDQRRHINKHS